MPDGLTPIGGPVYGQAPQRKDAAANPAKQPGGGQEEFPMGLVLLALALVAGIVVVKTYKRKG